MPADAVPWAWKESEDDALPANHVDFYTAVLCANALSERGGLASYYELRGESLQILGGSGYRLPSESEWEYACRAGTDTLYWSRDSEQDLARVGWFGGNSEGRVHAVAELDANAFGLHDMHGNVWQWCEDTWHDDYRNAPEDGRVWGSQASGFRVARGGSFDGTARFARSAYGFNDVPDGRSAARHGFRPARFVVSH